MNNKRRLIGIAAALILAIVGTFSLVAYVQSAKDQAVADEELVDVYVVDEFVPKGADVSAIRSAVSVEQVPARLKQDGAIVDLGAIDSEDVAAVDLQPGDQLVEARIGEQDDVIVEVPDKVQVSALLEAHRAVGGTIEKGDLVGVYLSFEPFDVAEFTFDPLTGEIVQSELPQDASNAILDSEDDEADAVRTAKTPNLTGLEFQKVLVTNVQTIAKPVVPDDDDSDHARRDRPLNGSGSTRFPFAAAPRWCRSKRPASSVVVGRGGSRRRLDSGARSTMASGAR